MKKQFKPACREARKLDLNKRTVSNLNVAEMTQRVGGAPTNGNCGQPTVHGHTCNTNGPQCYSWRRC